jgi:hypothetical protein
MASVYRGGFQWKSWSTSPDNLGCLRDVIVRLRRILHTGFCEPQHEASLGNLELS